jgi:cell division transport system ATP-binding protein
MTADSPPFLLRFEKVGLRYGQGPEILRDLDLALTPGSFQFITGSSGAGKSSLMQLMYLARPPSRGRITLFGRDTSRMRRQDLVQFRRRIGVVFQDFRLLDHLTAFENVALPLRVAGVSDSELRSHVLELLNWVGLGDAIEATPPTLSGGQKQRIAIARAVINRPDLLLADEPTGNVDDRIALRLLYLFEELHRSGTTLIIATHNQALIDRLKHPVLHLADGTLTVEPAAGAAP